MADPAQIAALQATIVRQQAMLDSGVTQQLENGRMLRIDLDKVQQQLNANIAALAALTTTPRQVRRLLTFTPSRGY